ncbi:hypothetical protein F5146DRAFT_1006536 [Armillaria mellea]|nr:hypothetical protein F5146DRAFT_1006536 [Armillaria mellea]
MYSLPFWLRCSLLLGATHDLAQAGILHDSEMQKWGLECSRGWEGLIHETCNELKGKNIVFTQIKEKFGKLRIYVGKADQETRRYLEEMEEKLGKFLSTGRRYYLYKSMGTEVVEDAPILTTPLPMVSSSALQAV